jgi:hypothetical protein
MYMFLLLIIYNQIDFYIVFRTGCLEMNQFVMFCNTGLLSKTDIFIVHTSSNKNVINSVPCLELRV